jgi:hypothetical protein
MFRFAGISSGYKESCSRASKGWIISEMNSNKSTNAFVIGWFPSRTIEYLDQR